MLARVLTEKLFSAGEFRFSLGIGSVEPADFFRNVEGDRLLELRRQALDESVSDYLYAIRDEGTWSAARDFISGLEPGVDTTSVDSLGRSWEPDFVILDRAAPHQVSGGCVCFPSGWSLREKIGKSLFLTHQPVPGLNDDLGANISKLLSRIEAGQFFQRTNWGLTRAAELDQHPRHKIPAIGAEADPRRVYLRIEWQVLTAISGASGVETPSASQARHAPRGAAALLFGIRVFHVPVEEVKSSPELASRLARNLETMPDAVAQYKRLDQCRGWLVKYLCR
jgi:heme-dependent oxidative N-demethylase alpha subunit-like protein